jgi:hypothetical protein
MGYKLLAKAPHLVQQDLPLPRRQSKGPHKMTHSQQELKTSMFKLRLDSIQRVMQFALPLVSSNYELVSRLLPETYKIVMLLLPLAITVYR